MDYRDSLEIHLRDGVIQTSANEGEDEEPLALLARGLGTCLLRFTDRFLLRRELPRSARMTVAWELQMSHCQLSSLRATLHLPASLAAHEETPLCRMLRTCPVHKALAPGVPVTIHVSSPGGHFTLAADE